MESRLGITNCTVSQERHLQHSKEPKIFPHRSQSTDIEPSMLAPSAPNTPFSRLKSQDKTYLRGKDQIESRPPSDGWKNIVDLKQKTTATPLFIGNGCYSWTVDGRLWSISSRYLTRLSTVMSCQLLVVLNRIRFELQFLWQIRFSLLISN